MKKDFIKELKWRGMLHDMIPGTEEHLEKNKTIGYIGFDPTSDSLHIGSLVPIFILKHFQNHGHTPIVLLGGATGMIGDPSGKSDERNLLDKEVLDFNEKKLTKQFEKFLDFKSNKSNKAILVNNYNWMKKFSIIDFSRDIGKHITVNYMMAKESVKKRISKDTTQGMSFTEFTYQLIQGYDFLHLYKEMKCMLQMGGSDQWGNITTGTELIKRKENKKVFAMTCPLIKKSDGSKFGKSEGGNIWLDKEKTSVYKFYQYWLNISDEDAVNYIKVFTFLSEHEIGDLINEHQKDKSKRLLQNKIADSITSMVHSEDDLLNAVKASKVLFGKSSKEDLESLDENTFNEIFDGVPSSSIDSKELAKGINIDILLAKDTNFLKSMGEARRSIKENSISVNKIKVSENTVVSNKDLINNKYLLLKRGRKNYYLVIVK
jgi:tyrosyl-tRNA synthetase